MPEAVVGTSELENSTTFLLYEVLLTLFMTTF